MEFLRNKKFGTGPAGPGHSPVPIFSRNYPNLLKNTKTALTFERIELESCARTYSIRFEILYNIGTTATL